MDTKWRELLQAIDSVHDALKLRPVNQVEGALLARKHLEGDAPRRSNHASRFLRGEIASRNRVEGQMNQNPQSANASAFFVDLFLGGCSGTLLHDIHDWARGWYSNYYELG